MSDRFNWLGFSVILSLIRPLSLPILLSVARLLLWMDFQKFGLMWETAIQGASLLFIVKKCLNRVVRSCKREQTSTVAGNGHALTASTEYGATFAYTLKATFFQDSH